MRGDSCGEDGGKYVHRVVCPEHQDGHGLEDGHDSCGEGEPRAVKPGEFDRPIDGDGGVARKEKVAQPLTFSMAIILACLRSTFPVARIGMVST